MSTCYHLFGFFSGPLNLGKGVGVIVDLVLLEVKDEQDAVDTRPECHGAIAVLANDVAMDGLHVDIEMISKDPAESREVVLAMSIVLGASSARREDESRGSPSAASPTVPATPLAIRG